MVFKIDITKEPLSSADLGAHGKKAAFHFILRMVGLLILVWVACHLLAEAPDYWLYVLGITLGLGAAVVKSNPYITTDFRAADDSDYPPLLPLLDVPEVKRYISKVNAQHRRLIHQEIIAMHDFALQAAYANELDSAKRLVLAVGHPIEGS